MSAAPATSNKPAPIALTVERVETAERHLLGRLLQLGQLGKARTDYERVSDLKPSDFGKQSHSLIWQAMQSLSARQENINLTTVEDEMGRALGRAINGEGASYLLSLTSGKFGDVADSAKIIRKASWRRKGKAAAREMDKMFDNDMIDETQVLEQTTELVERISQGAIALTGKTGVSLHESVGMVLNRVQLAAQAREEDGEILHYGIMSGLKAIDEVTLGFQPGEVTIITGSTGTGKSALGIKIARNAMLTGNRVCFVPLEMTHLQMTQRFMAIETRINGTAIKLGTIPTETLPRFFEACGRIQAREMSKQFTYLDLDPRPNIKQLKAKLIAHINLYSPQLIIVDQASIEAMSGTHPRLDEKQVISEIVVELKALAEKFNIHFVIIAQLNRAAKNVADGQRPTSENLASSSSVEKSAKTVIILYREKKQEQKPVEPVEIIFAKNRDGWEGTRYANFIPSLTDYVDEGQPS